MSTPDEKKNFDWEEGGIMKEEQYSSLGDVRSKGLPKLSKALAADPKRRKDEREKLLVTQQSKPYKPGLKKDSEKNSESDGTIAIEQSGISDEIENSAAKKLIDAGHKLKGVDRFGHKK